MSNSPDSANRLSDEADSECTKATRVCEALKMMSECHDAEQVHTIVLVPSTLSPIVVPRGGLGWFVLPHDHSEPIQSKCSAALERFTSLRRLVALVDTPGETEGVYLFSQSCSASSATVERRPLKARGVAAGVMIAGIHAGLECAVVMVSHRLIGVPARVYRDVFEVLQSIISELQGASRPDFDRLVGSLKPINQAASLYS